MNLWGLGDGDALACGLDQRNTDQRDYEQHDEYRNQRGITVRLIGACVTTNDAS